MAHVDCLSRAAVETENKDGMMGEVYEKRLGVFQIIPEEDRIIMIQQSDQKPRGTIDILKKDEKIEPKTRKPSK